MKRSFRSPLLVALALGGLTGCSFSINHSSAPTPAPATAATTAPTPPPAPAVPSATVVAPEMTPPPGTVAYKAPRPRLSPHETISAVVAGNRVTITYGRPHTADPKTGEMRTVWGGQLVPFNKIWRTGADEATLLVTQKDITLGEGDSALPLPAGAYTLFTMLDASGSARLVVSRAIGEWGLQYKKDQDFGSVELKKDTLAVPLHQFTMAVEKTGATTGVIKLLWEDTQFSVPFSVGK